MALLGYARVSSRDQDCAIQEAALLKAGCSVVRCEKRSGTTTAGRQELETVLSFLAAGDTLVITRLDRLARSLEDLLRIVRTIQERGASLRATEQPVDTSSASGRAFLQMLGVFAEMETGLRMERQMEGIAKARASGVYRRGVGGKPRVDVAEALRLRATGMRPADIARELKVARPSLYRALARADADKAIEPA